MKTWIDALVSSGKLDASAVKGKWKSFVITSIENPAPGIKQAVTAIQGFVLVAPGSG